MNIKNEPIEEDNNLDVDINPYDYCNTVLIKEEGNISDDKGEINWNTTETSHQVDVKRIKLEIEDDIAEIKDEKEEEDPLNIDMITPSGSSKEKKKYITCTFCCKSFCGKLVKALKCDFCDEIFQWQCRMKLHVQKVHNIGKK